jgi:ACS family glucarate transporter-like MFS transporter
VWRTILSAPLTTSDSALAVAQASRVRYQVLAAACSMAIVVYIHRVGFARALPKVSSDLDLGDHHAGWLTAIFMLAYGIFEIPWGASGDRLGTRHLLTVLVLGSSLLTGCVALVVFLPGIPPWPFAALLVLRFLFGGVQAGAFPMVSRMMGDWIPLRERGSAQGFIWMSTRFGGMLIPLLLGWLMTRTGNWQTPLWIVSGLGVLWAAAFWPWFRNRPEEKPGVNAAERELIVAGRSPTCASGHHHIPWAKLFRSRSVWALCLMYGCVGFAANFYVGMLPTYLDKHRHLPDNQVDWLSSLPFACGAVACLTGGVVSDWIIRKTGNRKWGRRLSGTIGLSLGSVGWLCLARAQDFWVLAFLLCFIFFCNDLSMGPAWAACVDVGERYAGTVGGAMNMIGSFGGALGNVFAGYLFQARNPEFVFVIYACSFALAAVCWQGVDVTKPLSAEVDETSDK